MLCWTCFEWFLIVQVVDVLRYTRGPFPEWICSIQLFVKNGIFIQQMLLMTATILTRYVFIFWLKNPIAFNDDFWSVFFNIWIFGFSAITEFVSSRLPGKDQIYFNICTGTDPTVGANQTSDRKGFHLTVISLVMVLSHLLVALKIFLYKRKAVNDVNPNGANNFFAKTTLTDLTTNVVPVLASSVVIFLIWMLNTIPPMELNLYPNYLYEYFFRLISPHVFSLTLVLLHYCRHPSLTRTLIAELKNNFKCFN